MQHHLVFRSDELYSFPFFKKISLNKTFLNNINIRKLTLTKTCLESCMRLKSELSLEGDIRTRHGKDVLPWILQTDAVGCPATCSSRRTATYAYNFACVKDQYVKEMHRDIILVNNPQH